MTTVRSLHADAPPERLAAVRLLSGVFALGYLAVRSPAYLALRGRSPRDFDGVGVLAWMGNPVADSVVVAAMVLALLSGFAFTAGLWFRLTGPTFALTVLLLATYRSSWGQLLHFENLLVLHLLVLGVAASADAWSFDAWCRPTPCRNRAYGPPLFLLCVVVVVTYLIAGGAKLRYGGTDWISGDTLRNHIAYSATRLEVLGGSPSPLAAVTVRHPWALGPMAAASVLIELAAPLALLGGWWRNAWVAAAWAMHALIAALMFVVFPYPLFLVAFAPFFALERAAAWVNVPRKRSAERRSVSAS